MKALIAIAKDEFDPCGNGKAIRLLAEHGVAVDCYEGPGACMPLADFYRVLPAYDAVIHFGSIPIPKEQLLRAVRLKILSVFGVGYNGIDCAYARERGIDVTISRVPEHSNGVAEMAHALLRSMLCQIPQRYAELKKGVWHQGMNTQLSGKTVGFAGFGAIAQAFASQLQGAGVRLLAYDLYPNQGAAAALGVTFVPFSELLSNSDVVSIHIPAAPETFHLFNGQAFAQMQSGSYLLNTARGTLVDEAALYCALTSGKLAAAATDVFEQEPVDFENPLLQLENFIATPHTGGSNYEARRALSVSAAQAVVDSLQGRKPYLLVN